MKAVLGLVLGAAAATVGHGAGAAAIVGQFPGIVVPGIVFGVSWWVTWRLYRRFSRG